MSARNNWVLTVILVICSWALVRAQDTDDVIKVDTTLVTVNISVTNSKGHHLAGLKPEDFQVTDEGRPVRPEFFDSQGPASLVFVVDTSSSMKGHWQQLKSGLKKFLAKANQENDYTLIAFNQTARLVIFSVGARELWQHFNDLKPSGETALYDALLLGLDTVRRVPARHKALVLLSDGADTASAAAFSLVQQEAISQRATIYAVGIFLRPLMLPEQLSSQELLKQLAAGSGGLSFFPDREEIGEALEKIYTDVSGQYTLSYYPPEKKPGRRTIQVGITQNPRRCKLRYQQTYVMK